MCRSRDEDVGDIADKTCPELGSTRGVRVNIFEELDQITPCVTDQLQALHFHLRDGLGG